MFHYGIDVIFMGGVGQEERERERGRGSKRETTMHLADLAKELTCLCYICMCYTFLCCNYLSLFSPLVAGFAVSGIMLSLAYCWLTKGPVAKSSMYG